MKSDVSVPLRPFNLVCAQHFSVVILGYAKLELDIQALCTRVIAAPFTMTFERLLYVQPKLIDLPHQE
jgi:hypothetical protein